MQTAMRRSCRCLRAPVKGASKPRLASTAAPAAKANSRLALQLAALTLTATAAFALGSSAADLRTVKPNYQPPTEAGFATALAEIKQLLPEDCLSQAENDLMAHGTSDWQCASLQRRRKCSDSQIQIICQQHCRERSFTLARPKTSRRLSRSPVDITYLSSPLRAARRSRPTSSAPTLSKIGCDSKPTHSRKNRIRASLSRLISARI
jgi:hypothetical protein